MNPGPAVLQDKIGYFRSTSNAIALAVPKDGNETFLVFILGVPSESKLYPEDLDWTVLDESNHESKSIGFGFPLYFEWAPQNPNTYVFFGQLLSGSAIVRSKSAYADLAVIFIVPKGTSAVTLLGPQTQTHIVSLTTNLVLDSSQIPTITCDPSFLEQPNGSENWTFTP